MTLETMTTCRYQILAGDPWKIGLLLNDGDLGILSEEGEILGKTLWDYQTIGNSLSLNIGALLEIEKKSWDIKDGNHIEGI